jgi:hypothetical protein
MQSYNMRSKHTVIVAQSITDVHDEKELELDLAKNGKRQR